MISFLSGSSLRFLLSMIFSLGYEDLDGDTDPDVVLGQMEGLGGNPFYFDIK
jgi:hypothetical protein